MCECATFEAILKNLALPEDLSGLLGAPLSGLGYKLQSAHGQDLMGNKFTYHEALDAKGDRALRLLHIECLERRDCVNTLAPLGFLFQDSSEPLVIFSDGNFVDPAYNQMAVLWQKKGPESVKLYTSYEVGLIRNAKDDGEMLGQKVKEYLGLGVQTKPQPQPAPQHAGNGGQPAPPPKPVKIFISYSHKDTKYFDDTSLVGFLKGLKNDGADFWWDEDIPPGALWEKMIIERIKESQIALLLVSQFFLDSDYCNSKEIPLFLEQAEEAGLLIFPVMLSTCIWDDERHAWLKDRQYIPSNGKVLDKDFVTDGDRNQIFAEIRKKLRDEIKKRRGTP